MRTLYFPHTDGSKQSVSHLFGYQYFFSQAKYYPLRESWVVIIQIGTFAYLKHTNFSRVFFCEVKQIVFHEYLFLRMASFWKFWLYWFNRKKERIRKRQLNQGSCSSFFLSRSSQRHAGNDGKTVVIDWFWVKISRVFNFLKSTKIRKIREKIFTQELVHLREILQCQIP